MVRLLAILVGFAIALPAATSAPVPKHLFPKEQPLYYPTQKGATWVYLEDKVAHHYVVTDVEKNKAGDATVVSVAELTDGKQKPYRKMEVSRRGLIWLETTGGLAFDEPFWVLRCPVVAKEQWVYRTSGPGGIGNTEGTMTVVGVEEVEVPAGKFSAVRVEEEWTFRGGGNKFHHTYWFAPNVGLVKVDYGVSTRVLKSFTLGKN